MGELGTPGQPRLDEDANFHVLQCDTLCRCGTETSPR